MAQVRAVGSALLFAAILATGGAPQSRAAEPFTIDAILSQTGQAAFLGQAETQALQVLETVTNRSGGIGGRPIHFAISDSQSSPQVALQLANGMIAHHPAVIIGPSLGAGCKAIAAVVAQSGPVDYCLSNAINPPRGSYVFSTFPSIRVLMGVNQQFFRQRGWDSIATITTTDASGQDADQAITDTFDAAGSGVRVADREHFAVGDLTADAQMARVKSSGAKALIVWATGSPFSTVLRSAREVGLTVPILVTPANLSYAAMKQYATFMYDPAYFEAAPFIDATRISDPATKRAALAFEAAFKTINVQPDLGQAQGWDPASLVLDAYRHLGLDATATQLRDYIADIGKAHAFTGVYGRYDFTASTSNGLGPRNVIITRWEPNQNAWVAVTQPGGALLSSAEK